LHRGFVEIGLNALKDFGGLGVVSLLRFGESRQTLDRLGLDEPYQKSAKSPYKMRN
jgi:hypothetical protein